MYDYKVGGELGSCEITCQDFVPADSECDLPRITLTALESAANDEAEFGAFPTKPEIGETGHVWLDGIVDAPFFTIENARHAIAGALSAHLGRFVAETDVNLVCRS
jgi:hypothetical protein